MKYKKKRQDFHMIFINLKHGQSYNTILPSTGHTIPCQHGYSYHTNTWYAISYRIDPCTDAIIG